MQVPSLPESAHDWQVPEQAVLQQTPCWQKPELQSSPTAQVPPGGPLPQLPLTLTRVVAEAHALLRIVIARCHQQGSQPREQRALGGARGPIGRLDGAESGDREYERATSSGQ